MRLSVQLQFAEVYCQRDPGQARCRRRAASLADGNLVVDVEGKRPRRFTRLLQDFTIGGEDEMVFDPAADFRVAATRRDGKFVRGLGADFQEHREGQRSSVKRRPQIGGGRGQRQFEALAARFCLAVFIPRDSSADPKSGSWKRTASAVRNKVATGGGFSRCVQFRRPHILRPSRRHSG